MASTSDPAAGGEHGEGGAEDEAADVARRWVAAVMDERDLAGAWPLTDPDLRLVLAQHWIMSHEADGVVGPPEGWDAIAEGLAAWPATDPAWDRFAHERVRRWREFWPGFSAVTWGLRHVRPAGRPDVWVVTFVEPRGKLMSVKPGPPLEFRHLAVRRREGEYRVAGLDGAALFRPGWPPTPA